MQPILSQENGYIIYKKGTVMVNLPEPVVICITRPLGQG
jgi:hypothetical protein